MYIYEYIYIYIYIYVQDSSWSVPSSFSVLLSSLELSDTTSYEPYIRALLGLPPSKQGYLAHKKQCPSRNVL